MTADAALFEAGQRTGIWVRRVWPRHTVKSLQRELDINEAAAERIAAGQVSKSALEKLLRRFGWRFAAFVFEPYCGVAARVDAELVELKERLARLERETDRGRSHDSTNPIAGSTAAAAAGVSSMGREVAPRARGSVESKAGAP